MKIMKKANFKCPQCDYVQQIVIPQNCCLVFHKCEKCEKLISVPKDSKNCCVICEYADQPCPVGHKKTINKSLILRRVVWTLAIISVLVFLVILGSKIFYGYIVPQSRTIGSLGTLAILGFAFIAGIAAFFSPCPFAVFPAYIAYFLQTEGDGHEEGGGQKNNLVHALKIGTIVSLGIFTFYLAIGIIMAIFGTALAFYTNWLKLAIIPLFFIAGAFLLTGKSLKIKALGDLSDSLARRAKGGKHFINMYLYGVVYGIAAAACHLPILIVIALVPILAGNLFLGLTTFVVYALGASMMLISLTVLASKNKKLLIKNLGLYGNTVKKVAGVIFILTGIYLISFYVLFKM